MLIHMPVHTHTHTPACTYVINKHSACGASEGMLHCEILFTHVLIG